MPTEKYAHRARDLRPRASASPPTTACTTTRCSHQVTQAGVGRGDVALAIRTDRGDAIRPLRGDGHRPAAPCPSCRASPASTPSPAIAFHTSRWDYAYTGGESVGRADGPAGRQAGGHHRHRRHRGAVHPAPGAGLGRAVRLPAHAVVDRRAQQPADRPRVVRHRWTPGWQQRWLDNFATLQTGGFADEDLVMDGWTDMAKRIRDRWFMPHRRRRARSPPNDAARLRGGRRREDD
jgi:hypothetical protein